MDPFTFDTSGCVARPPTQDGHADGWWCWSDLDSFTQGYVEAMFASAGLAIVDRWGDGENDCDENWAAFSDLAPETLARIIADCAGNHADRQAGLGFWHKRRSRELWPVYPPLTPYLGDDGKVHLREGA